MQQFTEDKPTLNYFYHQVPDKRNLLTDSLGKEALLFAFVFDSPCRPGEKRLHDRDWGTCGPGRGSQTGLFRDQVGEQTERLTCRLHRLFSTNLTNDLKQLAKTLKILASALANLH